MTALYREFTLNSPAAWRDFKAVVRENAKPHNDAGKPLRVILTSSESKRSSEANAFYWSFVLPQIAEQAWVDGRQHSKEVWHEYFAQAFAEKIEFALPDGEILIRRKSTSEMRVGEFSNYIKQVESFAATELGVRFVESRI